MAHLQASHCLFSIKDLQIQESSILKGTCCCNVRKFTPFHVRNDGETKLRPNLRCNYDCIFNFVLGISYNNYNKLDPICYLISGKSSARKQAQSSFKNMS
ncbi:hypothetical protein FRX31_014316 [Thalictrum thalictroides]|uniref:Uncharacterized protein n=1 Tax=Thalictrum thalictroides TaxID=46969 RepID=A0A7J6WGQ8_THATH|nr:hypothetical protein FRX31_014316 [Thalictrum thalictroides]